MTVCVVRRAIRKQGVFVPSHTASSASHECRLGGLMHTQYDNGERRNIITAMDYGSRPTEARSVSPTLDQRRLAHLRSFRFRYGFNKRVPATDPAGPCVCPFSSMAQLTLSNYISSHYLYCILYTSCIEAVLGDLRIMLTLKFISSSRIVSY